LTVGDRLLELAHTDERAVLFTIIEGPNAGARLLVLLERDETVGDAPTALAALAPEIKRNGLHEVDGSKVFAEVYGPPPRLVVVVWVGFDNNYPTFESSKGFTGSGLPLQIWARFMKDVKRYRPELLSGDF